MILPRAGKTLFLRTNRVRKRSSINIGQPRHGLCEVEDCHRRHAATTLRLHGYELRQRLENRGELRYEVADLRTAGPFRDFLRETNPSTPLQTPPTSEFERWC